MIKQILKTIEKRRKIRRVKKAVHEAAKATKKRVVAHSKRVAVQYRINRVRKFNGKKYYLADFVTNRNRADEIIRSARADGVPTRGTWVNGGYAIYRSIKSYE